MGARPASKCQWLLLYFLSQRRKSVEAIMFQFAIWTIAWHMQYSCGF